VLMSDSEGPSIASGARRKMKFLKSCRCVCCVAVAWDRERDRRRSFQLNHMQSGRTRAHNPNTAPHPPRCHEQ
jgi:predicted DNA-binding transcriptional regulator YafY